MSNITHSHTPHHATWRLPSWKCQYVSTPCIFHLFIATHSKGFYSLYVSNVPLLMQQIIYLESITCYIHSDPFLRQTIISNWCKMPINGAVTRYQFLLTISAAPYLLNSQIMNKTSRSEKPMSSQKR